MTENEPWPQDRREELALLIELVEIASRLNRSTGVIANIMRLAELSEKLTRADVVEPRDSFLQFLTLKAIGDTIA